MKIPFNEEWMLFEREDYANYFFVYSTWEAYTCLPKRWNFPNGRFMGAEFVNGACNLFMPRRYYDDMNRKNFQSLFAAPERWDVLHRLNNNASRKLFSFSEMVREMRAEKLKDGDVFSILKEFFSLQNVVHVPRGPIWQMETPKNILNDYLHSYLEEQRQEYGVSFDIGEAFRILTTPRAENILGEERRELVSIALERDTSKREKRLLRHTEKYEWLEYGLQGRILPFEHFREELTRIEGEDPRRILDRLREEKHAVVKKQKEVTSKFHIGKNHGKIFKIVRDSLFSRLYSKFAQFYAYYSLETILKEIGGRHGLSLEEIKFLSPVDLEKMLCHRRGRGTDWSALARSHKVHSVHISEKGKTKIWTGMEAGEIMKRIRWNTEETESKHSDSIRGQVAFKGHARGRVKIVNTVSELAKMHKGNILVSHMTNPDIVPAMKMAAAIVTDLGGITCHAAIVARELGKPCIIGTKIATKVLKDGNMVEVNADKGIVKIIK
ncbi:MAG: PEP-utilizing enzyme [bacterium]|nr:PEP-utilizing enzyme [bacterium]